MNCEGRVAAWGRGGGLTVTGIVERGLAWVGARRRAVGLSIFVLMCALLIPSGYVDSVDAGARLALTRAIVERGEGSVPDDLALAMSVPDAYLRGRTGRLLPQYAPGQSVAWIPAWAVGKVVGRWAGIRPDLLATATISSVNVLVTLATLGVLAFATKAWTGSDRATGGVAFLYLFGTPALAYANSCFSEPLVGLLLLLAFAGPLLWDHPASRLTGATCAGAAATVKPELLLVAAGFAAMLLVDRIRGRRLVGILAGFLALPVLAVMHRLVVLHGLTGGPAFPGAAKTYYSGSGFGAPWRGLGMFLGAGDKSLWFFFPGLLVGVAGWWLLRRDPRRQGAAAGIFVVWVVLLVAYASWLDPGGGMSFGPRFFVSLAPVTLLPGGVAVDRLVRFRFAGPPWTFIVVPALAVGSLASAGLQIAGMSVRDHQADSIAAEVGIRRWEAKTRLLVLKISRGVGGQELYATSDFRPLRPGEQDARIDHRRVRTYQFLNHWWSIAWANEVRHVRPVSVTMSLPPSRSLVGQDDGGGDALGVGSTSRAGEVSEFGGES